MKYYRIGKAARRQFNQDFMEEMNKRCKELSMSQTNNLQCIAEHTVDLSLINRDSKVLDLGCRSFSWSKAMLEYVDKIYCVDADPNIPMPSEQIRFLCAAVSDKDGEVVKYKVFGNGTGNHLDHGIIPKGSAHKYIEVKTSTLETISGTASVLFWDLIKMDIEGSEIPVLLSLTKPPAKQLSVEFHMHTGTTKDKIHEVFSHLELLGYEKVFADYSRKHGLGENYWDVLFILK